MESVPLSVNDVIDQQPVRSFQVWTIVLCGVVLILDGFDAQTIGFLAPSVSQSLHIPLNTFGPIFSASLVGLMIAAMAAGPIADRWGRRWPVISSTLLFAAFSILTAHASSFRELLIFRFLTGVGLGGAMPNVVAIASEYSPKRLLPLFVAALFAGMPLGGFICGMASSLLIPTLGWRSVFYLGGILPLAIAVLSIAKLPESVRFLSARGIGSDTVARIMAKIAPEIATNPAAFSATVETQRKGSAVKSLFSDGRALGTIFLWIPFFMNLLILYFVVNWLPALLRESGMSVANGVTATALFSLGGIVGSLAEGPLMKLFPASWLLVVEFILCAGLIGALGGTATSLFLVEGLAFLLGLMVTGAQAGINVLAASFYPTAIRSTGLGWALGVGRIGSIVGPLLAGTMLSFGWQPRQLLIAGAVPALIAASTIFLSRFVGGTVDAYRSDTDIVEAV
ncbi:MAG TPA: MFS transporter [Candidatus Dormibacteraeota bacterium]|nr:MFS transporter [Candidatus Dormibacteraeota bacterium]